MLWVYSHYKYFNSFTAGTVFIRQNLMHKVLKGLSTIERKIILTIQQNNEDCKYYIVSIVIVL